MNIEINCHSSIKIESEKIIYIDPFKIEKETNDADIIFITHDHYDHYSEKDIDKAINKNTIIVAPKTVQVSYKSNEIVKVEPNKKYEVLGIKVETIPSYNINKQFHPRENEWVGYILEIDEQKYYIPGDTDITPENKIVKCDVAFMPIGGTYTTDYKEAAELTNIIKPKIVIPMHYACIVGSKQDEIQFKKLIDKEIECKVLIK